MLMAEHFVVVQTGLFNACQTTSRDLPRLSVYVGLKDFRTKYLLVGEVWWRTAGIV